jgi:hypothetical protein
MAKYACSFKSFVAVSHAEASLIVSSADVHCKAYAADNRDHRPVVQLQCNVRAPIPAWLHVDATLMAERWLPVKWHRHFTRAR